MLRSLLVLLACASLAPAAPNVLFVFTDDQRFDTIAALGNQEIQTPTLDALVKRGCTFTNAYCQGGQSGA
jgi:arylsulfatase A-like enzyme